MHDRFRFRLQKRLLDFLPAREIAADEGRPFVDRKPMAFGQIVEDGNLMAFIEEQLHADASDVSSPADDKDFHPRKVRRASALSKESPRPREPHTRAAVAG